MSGLWEDIGGNVHRVTQRGTSVIAVLEVPTAEATTTFGFAAGDTTLRLTLNGKTLSGHLHLHYEVHFKSKCPRQWDFWEPITLTLEDSASTATGEWRFTKLDTNCVATPGDPQMQGWYISRPLVIEDLETTGFVNDSQPALVVTPDLPRFFVDDKGHASVDLDAQILTMVPALDVQMRRDGDVIQSVRVSLAGLKPSALSTERWFTLDFNELFAGRVTFARPTPDGPTFEARSLYGETEPFTIRVATPSGAIAGTSPPIDSWQLLDFMYQRATWLATTLFRLPLATARERSESEREGIAWRTFTNYRRPEVTILARNRGETTNVQAEPLRLYALFERGDFRAPGSSLLAWENEVTLAPEQDTVLTFYPDTIFRLRGSQMATFRGLYITSGTDTQRVQSEIEDKAGLRKLFKIDSLEPWRLAAFHINQQVGDNRTTARIVAAARDYVGIDLSAAGSAASLAVAAHRSAVEWSEMIAEFGRLDEQRRKLFASDDLGRLHENVNNDSKGDAIHIGLPLTSTTPTIRSVGAPRGYERTEYVLSMPAWDRFKAGVSAFATGGITAGEVPLPSRVRPDVDFAANAASRWRESRRYADSFRDVPIADLQSLADELAGNRKDRGFRYQIQGEVGEAMSARYVGRQMSQEFTQPGTRTLFIPGERIRDYTYDSRTGTFSTEPRQSGEARSGSKVTDGIVLVSRNRNLQMTNLEVKTGLADEAPGQVANNEDRIMRRGLTVFNPTPDEVEFFRREGYTVRRFKYTVAAGTSNAREVDVMHLQQGALRPHATAPRVVVIASDAALPEGPGPSVAIRRVPATGDDLRRVTNDLLRRRDVAHTLRLDPPFPVQPAGARREAAAAAALATEFAAAGAQEAERVMRLRLRVVVCRFADAKQTWIGVQRGNLVGGDRIVWEGGYRDASVQKMLLQSWYKASRSLWTRGDVPPWLRNAAPDGNGDRCD